MPSKTDCAELCRELQAEICRLKREFSAGKTYSASTQSPGPYTYNRMITALLILREIQNET